MTKEEKSWILYDVANSAFVLIMVTAIMPVFFKEIASKPLSQGESTAIWGYAISLSSLVLAIVSPFLGALADYRGNKKRLFNIFLFTGVAATIALAFWGNSGWLICISIFIVAKISWAASNIFYDSFLVDITSQERSDKISASGYASGYIGSTVPFILSILILMATDFNNLIKFKLVFIITALWWAMFSIPLIKNVRQKYFLEKTESEVRESFLRIGQNLRELKSHRNIFLFLIAYFFYIDGVDTIISMAAAYGIDSGVSTSSLIIAILFIQIIAFPFTALYGKFAARFSSKNMILVGIIIYSIITLIAFFLPSLESKVAKEVTFFGLSFLVATSMGGIQALSRSFYSQLIPPSRSAEFFGLYNIFGKFATILGPFLMGIATDISGNSRVGILCILLLFIVGGLLLKGIKK
ncbi:MAG TPA: MFS transporter [Spirochaetota bacterium]|nr:MFS transporter [Spirochaetota bacterium]HRU66770.1 MFS transporter [Spirochaetota bacterium]